jgi:tryptophan-rich sensory protein
VQLCLNLAWSFLFCLAGLLFVPYAAWVTYATILNASLWLLNKT